MDSQWLIQDLLLRIHIRCYEYAIEDKWAIWRSHCQVVMWLGLMDFESIWTDWQLSERIVNNIITECEKNGLWIYNIGRGLVYNIIMDSRIVNL